MPKVPSADPDHAEDLLDLLRAHKELSHLRVRRRGSVLTIESGPKDEPVQHARLCRATVHLWTLEIAAHTGEWQPSGLRGQMHELVDALVGQFPWVLSRIV
jgi:hypothetical protein